MKTNLILAGIILFLFAVYSYSIYELGKKSVKCEPEIHVVDNYIQVKDTIFIPKFIVRNITLKDTVLLKDTAWKDIEYVAAIDTTLEDSSFSGWIEFISPLPLHPASYFNFDFTVRQRTIYSNSVKEIYPHKQYFLGLGIVMPLVEEVVPEYFLEAGIYLANNSFLEVPIGLRANYIDKLTWELNAELRAKF